MDFKLKKNEIASVKLLKRDPNFDVFISSLTAYLASLDEANRSLLDPNLLYRSAGKSQVIASILSSIDRT